MAMHAVAWSNAGSAFKVDAKERTAGPDKHAGAQSPVSNKSLNCLAQNRCEVDFLCAESSRRPLIGAKQPKKQPQDSFSGSLLPFPTDNATLHPPYRGIGTYLFDPRRTSTTLGACMHYDLAVTPPLISQKSQSCNGI
jgi:hypothetical protein